ncbi:bifunctional DnaQ family exonuclease/ATP-dependent helicase [Streptococcus ovuberis]|uniref:3'-5' exonuclease DinG n=1 Tax=Streptococcus ovuberis TaxID=1936207 RepID=A0A7X6N163_9STRE|nr:bifunctional DnaQ family exonuclease/ATP-dependent helicase [Streptococcus ovuberis]NKZ20302.1 bifunctional DnaQ family exonuclease/ATP-dependent helicase [Streptococcus ovuberis]
MIKTRKYAIVDLEATSTGPDAKIIQVGIVLVQDGQLLEMYETDVNPHEDLTPHIKQLTGITDEQLRQAPVFSEVARDIFALLEDAVFVAHNVRFDANLLAEHLFLEGYELRTPRVDTVELSQVFFPSLERYSLGNLADYLGIELLDAHTAIADALATAKLFLAIQEKIITLPKVTLQKLLTYADHLLFETGQVLEELLSYTSDYLSAGYERVLDIVVKKPSYYAKARHLAPHFEQNSALLGLEERQQQVAFASVVENRLRDQNINFIQAQTGIGKTYGYLLPLLANCPDKQIIVAAPTKLLQDQIMQTEGTRLAEVFHLNCLSLKGYENYIKLDVFWASLSLEEDNRLLNRIKMQLLVWLTETETGDLDEIQQKFGAFNYFDRLRHDGHLSTSSLFTDIDFWQKGQFRAKISRLVITNQAYLLNRLADDPSFLVGKVLIIDEAQKLPLQLEHLSRRKVNLFELQNDSQQHLKTSPDLLTRRLLENIAYNLAQLVHQSTDIEKTVEALRQDLSELNVSFFPQLREVLDLRLDQFWISQEKWGETVVPYLHGASLSLGNFYELLPENTKVMAISATLAISQRVNLAQLLGVPEKRVTYDYLPQERLRSQTVFLLKELPDISSLTAQDYVNLIYHQILSLSQLNKPIIVLFTANQTLLEVAERLERSKLPYLAQHQHGTANQVKRRFERGEANILLGSGSFWEGADFIQQDQMILLVTRLPFENPSNPYVKKLNHHLAETGLNPFDDYHLPLAMLKLKQALGRTQRRKDQQSAVVLMDRRVLTKSYGQTIRLFLETICPVESVSPIDLPSKIETYFASGEEERKLP